MGTTPKKLKVIVTDPAILEWPEVKALQAQGHTFQVVYADASGWDAFIGPNCWRMSDQHRKFLDLMMDEARKIRYPTTKGKA